MCVKSSLSVCSTTDKESPNGTLLVCLFCLVHSMISLDYQEAYKWNICVNAQVARKSEKIHIQIENTYWYHNIYLSSNRCTRDSWRHDDTISRGGDKPSTYEWQRLAKINSNREKKKKKKKKKNARTPALKHKTPLLSFPFREIYSYHYYFSSRMKIRSCSLLL